MGLFNKKQTQLNKRDKVSSYINQLLRQMSQYNGGDLGLNNKKSLNYIFARNGYYRALVDKRGRDVARVPLELYDYSSGEKVKVTDSPLLDLLKKPNSEMTQIQLRKLTNVWYDNVGEWIWWKQRNISGKTIGLYPINPSKIYQKGSETETWKFSYENGEMEVSNDDIIYCRDINPDDEYGRGAGQGQATSDELSVAEKIAQMLEITFDNRAVPPYIITFDGMSEDALVQARENWFNKFKGFLKANIPMFANKSVDVKRLAYDFQETQVIEIGKEMKDTFREIWGIPKELMGDLGSSNRAASVESWNIYSENVIIPAMDLFVDILNCHLVPEFGENLKLEYVNPNKADRKFVSDHMAKFPFAYRVNEVRGLTGHVEWEGQQGEEIWTPLNFTSQFSPQGGNNQVFQEKKKMDLTIKKKSTNIKIVKNEEIEVDEQEIEDEELALLLLGLITATATSSYLFASLENVYKSIILEVGNQGLNELGSQLEYAINSVNTNNYINNLNTSTMVNIADTFKNKVSKVINDGIENKIPFSDIVTQVGDVFTGYQNGSDIKRIVETETTATTNFARLESAKQSKITGIKKQWITQRDDRVRESHLIDGQTKLLEEYFVLENGNTAQYPGDPNLPGEDRVNERCGLGYVVQDVALAGDTEESRTAYWKSMDAENEQYRRILTEQYKKVFKQLENDIANSLKEGGRK